MSATQEAIFWETIEILDTQEVLSNLILIGSWTEYIYQAANYYEGFRSNFRTMDLDFMIPNLRHPSKKVNLCSVMERHNFLVLQRPFDGLTKFSRGEGPLEIEFIARELGVGRTEPYKVESLGIRVEGLRHMDILSLNTIVLLVRTHYITVPIPPAYVLHKLVINERRGIKKEKDLAAVENLLGYIRRSGTELAKLQEIYERLTKKERAAVIETCKKNLIKLFD